MSPDFRGQIEEQLKAACLKITRHRPAHIFPSTIKLTPGSSNSCILTMSTTGITGNMQNDAAAFEAWALLLHCWTDYKRIVLHWTAPEDTSDGHYQRFLFRASCFAEHYGDWFSIAPESARLLTKAKMLTSSQLRLNHPQAGRAERLQQSPSTPFKKLSEHDTEILFTGRYAHKLQAVLPELAARSLSWQLPVGVFANEVRRANAILTGGKSAIDMWGLDHDKTTLYLFELKKPGAQGKAGIISELFFYAMLMRMVQTGKVTVTEPSDLTRTRKIVACTLVHTIHPLLTGKRVEAVLNTTASAMRYKFLAYDAQFNCTIIGE